MGLSPIERRASTKVTQSPKSIAIYQTHAYNSRALSPKNHEVNCDTVELIREKKESP